MIIRNIVTIAIVVMILISDETLRNKALRYNDLKKQTKNIYI